MGRLSALVSCSVYFEFELSLVLMCLVSFIPTNTSPLTFFIAILDGLCGWKSGALTTMLL